ncbi:MAG: GNAT family N-acetyltransferase [Asgard group archaeon]
MLRIRQFVKGKDEQVWINIVNKAFKEYEDRRPLTLDFLETWEKSPAFDDTGMLIAEFDGKPAGCIDAFIDKRMKGKKGYIRNFGVVYEYRRKGIGRQLLKKALESLRERGMESAEVEVQDDKIAGKNLFESMGFRPVRLFSRMITDLSNIPSGIGENKEITIKMLHKDGEEDIKLLVYLANKAFKEHYDYRPETVEETMFWFQQIPSWLYYEFFFAYLQDKPVGFIGVKIDAKYNESRKKKAGYIQTMGVIKPYRRRGIGKALMLHGLNFLKLKGMEETELDVDDSNPTHTLELYEKTGFHVHRKTIAYKKELD